MSKLPSAYDHMDVVSDLLDTEIHITEKLVGREWVVKAEPPGRNETEAILFVQKFDGDRERAVEDEIALVAQNLDYMLESMYAAKNDKGQIILRGVYTDPKIYGANLPSVRLYEIEVDRQVLDAATTFALFACYAVPHVPVLSLPGQTLGEWLGRRSLQESAKGRSRLAKTDRLGVVIRTLYEMNHPSVGRAVLKAEQVAQE